MNAVDKFFEAKLTKEERTWVKWLEENGMIPDENGNMDEDYGNIYSEDAQTRASEWFYQEFLTWQKKGGN